MNGFEKSEDLTEGEEDENENDFTDVQIKDEFAAYTKVSMTVGI